MFTDHPVACPAGDVGLPQFTLSELETLLPELGLASSQGVLYTERNVPLLLSPTCCSCFFSSLISLRVISQSVRFLLVKEGHLCNSHDHRPHGVFLEAQRLAYALGPGAT